MGVAGGVGELQKMRLEAVSMSWAAGTEWRDGKRRGRKNCPQDYMQRKTESASAVFSQVSTLRNENSSLSRREKSSPGTERSRAMCWSSEVFVRL